MGINKYFVARLNIHPGGQFFVKIFWFDSNCICRRFSWVLSPGEWGENLFGWEQ